MKKTLALTAVCAAALVGSQASAQAIACGQDYTVRAGDYLSQIAVRAYGRSGNFNLIYTANAREIGPNPALINVGQELFIPCEDADLGTSTANAAVVGREKTTEALPSPSSSRPIRVLTATDWAPFTNEEQEQGGLLTEVANLALAQADGNPEYQIDFVNDWGAHLSPLLTDHAYDFSIGWIKPDCDLLDQLSEDSQFRCNNFNWTEPLFQQVVAYYTLQDAQNYTDHTQIIGMNVCRPTGYSTSMLEEVGLAEPDITLVRPADPTACLNAVISGEADVALVATDVAEGILAGFEDPDIVKMHEPLSYVSSMRALISKTHPQSDELVETFNSGLTKIKDSGVWFATIRRHMTAHREAES